MPDIQPGYKEELTDMFKPEAIPKIKVGSVLKFEYEGSITCIRITRRTQTRIWGVHVTLLDYNTMMSHYGHNLDATEEPTWCDDCECPVTEVSNAFGRAASLKRQREEQEKAKEAEKKSTDVQPEKEGKDGEETVL